MPKPLYRTKPPKKTGDDFVHCEPISPAHFELREDGTIAVEKRQEKQAPVLTFRDDTRNLWLYQGNSLELLDAIAAKYPEGRFDCIFADPPYFLSNGGISCHAGRMVNRSATVDVIWFNERKKPNSFFEVEHGTDMKNSLLKFNDLQDFHSRMVIVSDSSRRSEFAAKIKFSAFRDIARRVDFLSYERLVRDYEYEVETDCSGFKL